MRTNNREGSSTIRSKRTQTNGQIKADPVRLIDQEGNQAGVLSLAQALLVAKEAGLDLVEISPQADPPVCRIMDYGKYLFEQNKKKGSNKKKQHVVQVKEVKFRPTTDVGDYKIKLRKIVAFLESGDKVKISLRFRGREMQHKELGMELLNRLKQDLDQVGQVEQEAKMEGRQMQMLLVPVLKKQ